VNIIEFCVGYVFPNFQVESPSQFFCIYKQYEERLGQVSDFINANLSSSILPDSQAIPGTLCLAPFEQMYYRARIRARNHIKEVFVFFVDYGNSAWVPIRVLQPFSPAHALAEVHITPTLALECRLSEIRPSRLYNSVWPEEAVSKFKGFTMNNPNLHGLRIDVSLSNSNLVSFHCWFRFF
jgi:hypothetical protein